MLVNKEFDMFSEVNIDEFIPELKRIYEADSGEEISYHYSLRRFFLSAGESELMLRFTHEAIVIARIIFMNTRQGNGSAVLKIVKRMATYLGYDEIQVESASTEEMFSFCKKYDFIRINPDEDDIFSNWKLILGGKVMITTQQVLAWAMGANNTEDLLLIVHKHVARDDIFRYHPDTEKLHKEGFRKMKKLVPVIEQILPQLDPKKFSNPLFQVACEMIVSRDPRITETLMPQLYKIITGHSAFRMEPEEFFVALTKIITNTGPTKNPEDLAIVSSAAEEVRIGLADSVLNHQAIEYLKSLSPKEMESAFDLVELGNIEWILTGKSFRASPSATVDAIIHALKPLKGNLYYGTFMEYEGTSKDLEKHISSVRQMEENLKSLAEDQCLLSGDIDALVRAGNVMRRYQQTLKDSLADKKATEVQNLNSFGE